MYIAEGRVPCMNEDPNLWFSKENSAKTATAVTLCRSCPERDACLAAALVFEKKQGRT